MKYTVSGICARSISFDIVDGIVKNVAFEGGCDGNHKGLAGLAEGMKAQELVDRLSGIRCGSKSTSCPDQLARLVKKAIAKE